MPKPNAGSGISETNRHPHFYIPGGDLYLLVENVHFCVPSYFFTREPRSEFREKTSGRSHATPLLIDDVKSEDLETLLQVVLNPKYTDFRFMTVPKWITVLNLAHKWKFDNLKEAAIRELQKEEIDTISRIELYKNNGVDDRYILPLYADLCQKDGTAITLQESKRVGTDATYAVMQARETMLTTPAHFVLNDGGPRSPVPSQVPRASIFEILKTILNIDYNVEDLPGRDTARGDTATAANSQNDDNAQTANVNPNANSRSPRVNPPPPGKNPWQKTTTT